VDTFRIDICLAVRSSGRHASRWSSGELALRWTVAGMLEAERQLRTIIGYRDLATLVVAIERDHDRSRHRDAAHTPIKESGTGPRSARECSRVTGN